MNVQQTQQIVDVLSILKGQPLQFVFRSLDMICFEFGNVIVKKVIGRDQDGKASLVDGEAGKYALHIQTFFRLSAGSEILLARGDLFQPNSELAANEDYDGDEFDWNPNGNNRFDEVVKQHLSQPRDFLIADVSANRLGDLKLKFANGFVLEILVDVSGTEECWRFFEAESEEHLVVTGQGIEMEEA